MRLLASLFLLTFAATSFGQLTTSPGSASSLVQNTLLGPGVTVSNITFSGAAGALGQFSSNTNLGISSGIVMTTGTISDNGYGPQGPNDTPSSNNGFDNGYPGYSRLSQLAGADTKNAAILEFDFIPFSDSVKFRYVFGSEEYPEYVGSQFNDVFAFYISGPGIPGGSQNIAQLPNGGGIVAINNVNNGYQGTPASHPQYFVYNGTGSNGPYNSSSHYIQYDGFTKVLTASSKVQCGQTYHLVLAIADAVDGIYDSGIFLEANSLRSNISANVDYELSYDAFHDGKTMAEGCVDATVHVTRPLANAAQPITIPIVVTGTATPGTDYAPTIPSSIMLAAGQTSYDFTFSALADGVTEGVETINMEFQIPNACGGVNPYTLPLKIDDVQPVAVEIIGDSMKCPNTAVVLSATASGGVGPYTYNWSSGETTSDITVIPTSSQTYTVTVEDNCLHQTATASYLVYVPTFQPLSISTSGDISELCPNVEHTISATVSGGGGEYTYRWTNISGIGLGRDTSITVSPSHSSWYYVTVSDQCGNSVIDSVHYVITTPQLVASTSPDQQICPYQSVTISGTAAGGYGAYHYSWSPVDETGASITVDPSETTVYTLTVTDECGSSATAKVTVSTVVPVADFSILSSLLFNAVPVTFQNQSVGAVSYAWNFGDGQSSSQVSPNNTYTDPGNYLVTLVATNALGCTDTLSKPLAIQDEYYIYIPNTFTPDNDRFNEYFEASTVNVSALEIWIYDRWGEVIFYSDNVRFAWDGTYLGKIVQDGTYTYKVKYTSDEGFSDTLLGHVNVLR